MDISILNDVDINNGDSHVYHDKWPKCKYLNVDEHRIVSANPLDSPGGVHRPTVHTPPTYNTNSPYGRTYV